MCKSIINSTLTFIFLNWSEIIQAIVGIWAVIVATCALQTWKKQSKAQRQTDFLDELADSIHDFINNTTTPIEMLKYIRIGIESHSPPCENEHKNKELGAQIFIEKRGEEYSTKIYQYLALCNQSLSRIRSLSAKGQILHFKNYNSCADACDILTRQYERISSVASFIGMRNLNWENEKIHSILLDVTAIDPLEIKQQIDKQNIAYLRFAKENYRESHK